MTDDAYERARMALRTNMMRSIITEPLLSRIQGGSREQFDVIIELNEFYRDGLSGALAVIEQQARRWKVRLGSVSCYVFARLSADRIRLLAAAAQELAAANRRDDAVVHRIWEDSDIAVTLTQSLTTVKADAAQRAFHALGQGIVWAVLDSGIDGGHVHFTEKQSVHGTVDTLNIRGPVEHRDYTPDGEAPAATVPSVPARGGAASALTDRLGHGSHVAGIIAGHWSTEAPDGLPVVGTEVRDVFTTERDAAKPVMTRETLSSISGVAPLTKLVSLKVIADVTRTDDHRQTRGQGKVSWVLRALEDIQRWNQYGRRLLIHGVNMSLGYDFDPRWFACGQSPICTEVNRLVKSGVCVVVSAGNGGYSSYITAAGVEESSYRNLSITDPGNAELAITVGSTHRDKPHTYGVSYFSSRGPTGDGRRKPDLLAPGEHIRSCAAGRERERFGGDATATDTVLYCEQTGTSMAAAHVSGAAAAFLSVRAEFIGQPERVKALFLNTAIDLGREPAFQGHGLLDLMKVLQSV